MIGGLGYCGLPLMVIAVTKGVVVGDKVRDPTAVGGSRPVDTTTTPAVDEDSALLLTLILVLNPLQ